MSQGMRWLRLPMATGRQRRGGPSEGLISQGMAWFVFFGLSLGLMIWAVTRVEPTYAKAGIRPLGQRVGCLHPAGNAES
jgi:hypothetical protein